MSDGPIVGDMHQGDAITNEPAAPREGFTPFRTPPAGPVPRGVQHQKETPGTVGRNTGMPR
jgi:hypothetical protein